MFTCQIKFEYVLKQKAVGTCILSQLSIADSVSCEGRTSGSNVSCFKIGLRFVLPRVLILRCGNI